MCLCMYFSGRPFALGIIVTASESSSDGDAEDDAVDAATDPLTTVLRDIVYALRSDIVCLVFCTIMICMWVIVFRNCDHCCVRIVVDTPVPFFQVRQSVDDGRNGSIDGAR